MTKPWMMGAFLALALGLITWYAMPTQHAVHDGAASNATAPPQGAVSATLAAPALQPPLNATPPALKASEPPLDNFSPIQHKPEELSDQEWHTMQEVVGKGANHDHELARMADYAVFQKKFIRWQNWPASVDQSSRQQLAQHLLDDIPMKVAQGVLASQQALAIQESLLKSTVEDASRRAQLADMERHRLPEQPAAAPAFPH